MERKKTSEMTILKGNLTRANFFFHWKKITRSYPATCFTYLGRYSFYRQTKKKILKKNNINKHLIHITGFTL